ncbi:MAG: hypothetical protein CSB46_04735 [Micrococcales bacterium]|nr:MAG: hypothetical protein CSB46_04735 [Micrococcales bacterium]
MRPLAVPLLTGLIAGLVIALVLTIVIVSQPSRYTARIALLGVPNQNAPTDSRAAADYAAVVAVTMPGVSELVRTPGALQQVTDQVPGSPSVEDVDKSITVELVPASSLTRISVSAEDPQTASALAVALGQQVIDADLLAPSGVFRFLDNQAPEAVKTAPDVQLGIGLGLASGFVLGVAAGAVHLLMRPRVYSRRQVVRIADDPSLPVIQVNSDNSLLPLRGLVATLPGVRLMPVGSGAAPAVTQLRRQLALEKPPASDDPVLLVAKLGVSRPQDITSARALTERAGRGVLGVALV